jgi:hypothetical protein
MDISPESLRNENDRNLRRHNHLDVCPSGKPLPYVRVSVCVCPSPVASVPVCVVECSL